MKTELSIERKPHLELKKNARSRCNPESSINLTTSSGHYHRTLKHSSSSSTLQHTIDPEISIIEDRYRMLELNYRTLLTETKRKGELFRKQKEDLDRYRLAHERDRKEIERLRTLIGFVKKTQCSTQTNQNDAFSTPSKNDSYCYSVGKSRKSPNKNYCLSKEYGISSKVSQTPLKKINSKLRQEQSQGQFSKYKFVPQLPLQ